LISGKQAGKLLAAQTKNEAHQQSRIVRATVTDVSERVTDGRIKCSIASTGEVVYVDAGVTLFDLTANDIVFIRKADASWRNLWYLIDLDHLDASDGAPAPALSTDIFGNLIAQSTCVIALEGHALGVTLDADKDTGIEATTDDRIDFMINTTLRHSFGLTSLVLNENGDDMDVRIEASGEANAFVIQGSDGYIGMGTAAPSTDLILTRAVNGDTMFQIYNTNAGTAARARLEINNDQGGFNLIVASSGYTDNISWQNMAVLGIDAALDGFIFYTPSGEDMVFECGAIGTTDVVFQGDGDVGIGAGITPAAQLHVDQSSTTAAQPVLMLDQADVSEEMIEFATTIGVGNAIEAIGAKALTTTHFIKVTLPGALTRYIPVGTIA
jgi:hypothetical protein